MIHAGGYLIQSDTSHLLSAAIERFGDTFVLSRVVRSCVACLLAFAFCLRDKLRKATDVLSHLELKPPVVLFVEISISGKSKTRTLCIVETRRIIQIGNCLNGHVPTLGLT